MSPINRELLKGSIELVLLVLLERGPMYGYQIVKEVKAESSGELQLKEGSLYPALHRLERAGLIEGYWQAREDGTSRRYYQLTSSGQQAAKTRRAEWKRFTTAIEGVLRHG
ncbi:PadR family transcriptional regulator [Ktedonosporobacter rubrisoli]|uniref:PadR family transcriptional regulator n=1 Tax=Ktedonosporobacter rubrisoli TaxID=2509675 RepID=A0A4V0YZ35_KTERU|nr:helix-turn-helix transcriptional regulator [Ktedonosporobacter rubrisoli]QBD78341.1 PadR family transcriptional regulator [Ktedonosporobacter rubrisoli]